MTSLQDRVMSMHDSKFIISCPARSGSTMLVHLLRSNPEVLCHGEVFGLEGKVGHLVGSCAAQRKVWDQELEQEFWTYSQCRPEGFLYDVVFNPQGRRLVGFKFKTDEAFDPKYQTVLDLIKRDASIKVVHLRRRNLLDQYISLQVVHTQTGLTLLTEGQARPDVRPLTIDIPHMLHFFADVMHREALAMQAYADHPQIVVDYEDLVDPENDAQVRLQEFLGLTPVPLTTPTQKIISDNLGLVEGADELFANLAERGLTQRAQA